jgi:mannitol-1-/sugar-/sorbitol-6-phosphatase
MLGPLSGRDFAAVIFDMDGTLVDSTAAVVRSWARWAEEEQIDPRRLQGFHGIPAMGIIAMVLPEERWQSAVERITALELADTEGIALLPGAAEALAALPPARCAIATSCTRDLAQARLEVSGLSAPRVVVTVDDVTRGKPHPEPFLEAARRLGVPAEHCLVVEDAPGGLEAARAAGCATLAVTTTTPAEELDADAVVGTLADVRFDVDGGVRVRRNAA